MRYLEDVKQSSRQPAYIAKDLRSLRMFFRWLAEEEGIEDPTSKIRTPIVEPKRVEILTDDQLTALLQACRGRTFTQRRDTAIIRVLFDTGDSPGRTRRPGG